MMKQQPSQPSTHRPVLSYEARDAKRRFGREMTWQVMLWFVCWVAIFIGVGVGFRSWLNVHKNISLLMAVGSIVIFCVPVIFISRRLHQRYGFICRTCGCHSFLSESGQCVRCETVTIRRHKRQ